MTDDAILAALLRRIARECYFDVRDDPGRAWLVVDGGLALTDEEAAAVGRLMVAQAGEE